MKGCKEEIESTFEAAYLLFVHILTVILLSIYYNGKRRFKKGVFRFIELKLDKWINVSCDY